MNLWQPAGDFPGALDTAMPDRVVHIMVHRGADDFRFLHESAIVRHGESFYVAWNASPVGESQAGTVVRWIRSDDDFQTWTEPRILAPALDHETTVWESCQFLSQDGRLWAFVGQVHSQPRSPAITGGRMIIFQLADDGATWLEQGAVEKFHPLNPPQLTASGNWVMGGQFNLNEPNVAISDGGDLSRWRVVGIPVNADHSINFAETALIADGNRVTAYVRSKESTMLVSTSPDGGESWPELRLSNLPMESSKICAGVLQSGRRFLVFNAVPGDPLLEGRHFLALATGAPGADCFDRLHSIRSGYSPRARTAGSCKSPQWSYPAVVEHNGQIYVTYSVTKEDCCLTRMAVPE